MLATFTWNTVSKALVIESKLDVGLPSGKLNWPPNNCIPSKANMKMKRKRRSNSDKMEEMAFIKATTKLRSEVQYLEQNKVYHITYC